MRKLIYTLLMLLSISSYAQSDKSGLKDDLLKDKDLELAKHIPMWDGTYLYKMYVLPIDEFLERINAYKTALIKKEKSAAGKELRALDADFSAKNVTAWYMGLYGMDSVGMENFRKMIEARKYTQKEFDSVYQKAYVKRLTPEERKRLADIVGYEGLNDTKLINNGDLFKRSAAYRKWLDGYITKLKNTKYKADTTFGYHGESVVKIKIVNQEISNPFIKEYLIFKATGDIIKRLDNKEAVAAAYRNFMKMSTNSAYKTEIEEAYGNYKRMADKGLSPDFSYNSIDNKLVALKDLRGKYVYIDVWATWCGPCKAEIPFLTKVEADYHGKNIHFVSLSVDRMADKAKWVAYVKEHNLGGIQLMADKDFSSDFIKKFNINAIPRFILIDPNGMIVSGDAKRPSDPELRKQLDTLLK